MPACDGLGPDDKQRPFPSRPASPQDDPKEPVMREKARVRMLRPQDNKLLTKCEVLQNEFTTRSKTAIQRYKKSPKYRQHRTGHITENTGQTEFWRGTPLAFGQLSMEV